MTQELFQKIKMAEEKVGKDWLKELGACDTKEQLKNKTDEWGIRLSEPEADEAFELLSNKKIAELTDEELNALAGGMVTVITPPGKVF